MNLDEMLPSKYLKQADVKHPTIVTVKDVVRESVGRDNDPKWCLYTRELDKPMTLNRTNLKRLAATTGSNTLEHWIGKRVEIFVDPNVEFGGDIVGGLRLRKPSNTGVQDMDDDIPARF